MEMKFQIGDKVLLLHSGETAEVMEFINDDMLMVELEGIVFPVFADQVDFPYFKAFSDKRPGADRSGSTPGKEIPPEKKQVPHTGENGIWLSILPVYHTESDQDLVHSLKLHLSNEDPVDYQFRYALWLRQDLFLELDNQLRAYSHFYLHDLLFEQLNDNPRFEMEFSLTKPDPRWADSVHRTIRPRASQVFRKLSELESRQDATFRFPVLEKYPESTPPGTLEYLHDMIPVPPPVPDQEFPGLSIEPAKYEVDLHMDKLMSDWQSLSKFEMLTLQLQEFTKYLELAILHRLPSMVVIHGVGKGRLKEETHQILEKTPEVLNFVNQYDARYGYGATEIFFDYKDH